MGNVTVKDVARHAKVSPSTVSLVLRNSPLVAAETLDQVRAAIDALGYVYNRGAANMRSRQSQTIGLIVCEITNPFYAELVAGIDKVMDSRGWIAFIGNSSESPTRQERFIARLREQNVDGIILTAAEGTKPELLGRLRAWGLPCVEALRRAGQHGGDYVGPDYSLGLSMAVQHLVNKGHRRIAYIGGARKTSATRERLSGYRDGLARLGIEPGPIVSCPASRENGWRAVRELLGTSSPPTAAICYNDIVGFGVVQGLIEAGRTPGTDFGVVGFDNIAEAALSRPALTTVAVQPNQIGEEAATLLLRRIENPDGRPERIIVPPRLVIRDT